MNHTEKRYCDKCGKWKTPPSFVAKNLCKCPIQNKEVEQLREAFDPVFDWYDGGGECSDRPFVDMLKDAITDLQNDRRECLRLRAEKEELKVIFREAYEVYAGSEIGRAETTAEAYSIQIIEQMLEPIRRGLR